MNKPSAGAMRAAQAFKDWLDGVAVPGTEKLAYEHVIRRLQDVYGSPARQVRALAQIIDGESGLAEAVEALHDAKVALELAGERHDEDRGTIGFFDFEIKRVREALAKIEGNTGGRP